jgi:hypothetical protein
VLIQADALKREAEQKREMERLNAQKNQNIPNEGDENI